MLQKRLNATQLGSIKLVDHSAQQNNGEKENKEPAKQITSINYYYYYIYLEQGLEHHTTKTIVTGEKERRKKKALRGT